MYVLDGIGFLEDGLDRIVDVIIHRGEMEPTIVVFLDPGKPLEEDYFSSPRNFEYDTVSPQFAQFIEVDVIPMVQERTGPNLSSDPRNRCILGSSSETYLGGHWRTRFSLYGAL